MPVMACRGCLAKGPRLYDLYSNNLYEAFVEVLGNPIFQLDDLPQHICGICYTFLSKYESFRNRCRRVQDLLEDVQIRGMQVSTQYIDSIDRKHHNLQLNLTKVEPRIDLVIKDEEDADPSHNEAVDDRKSPDYKIEIVPLKDESLSPPKEPSSPPEPDDPPSPFSEPLSPINELPSPSPVEPPLPIKRVLVEAVPLSRLKTKTKEKSKSKKPVKSPKVVVKSKSKPVATTKKQKQKPRKRKTKLSSLEDPKYLAAFEQKYNMNIVHLTKEQQIAEMQEKIQKGANNPKSVPFCPDCGKVFRNNGFLQKHFKNYHDESAGPALCELCKFRCTEKKMPQHRRIHELKLACKQCDFTMRFSTNFKPAENHAKSHEDPTNPCKYCDSVFESKKLLNAHLQTTHPTELLWCRCCGETFLGKQSWATHMTMFHKDLPNYAHQCQSCKVKFATSEALSMHLSLTCKDFNCVVCGFHVDTELELKDHVAVHNTNHKYIRLALCTSCGVKFFGPEPLARHLEEKTCGSGHPCQDCGVAFPTDKTLEEHRIDFHRVLYRACERCDKAFDPPNYRRHFKRVHNIDPPKDNRPRRRDTPRVWSVQGSIISAQSTPRARSPPLYVCDVCGKGCRKRADLKLHVSVRHTGKKPHTCDICNKGFPNKRDLQEHIFGHTGERPFQCAECPKTFRSKRELATHSLRMHTDLRRHICHICQMAFRTSSSVKTHIISAHLRERKPRRKRGPKRADDDDSDGALRKPRPRKRPRKNDTLLLNHAVDPRAPDVNSLG